ncbi:enoyl-CoA hydratase/isomerase family protein [Haloechinothrix halophila]|uniref:enoyl-CoA hydratase/isomerase family protein n=1 Tax=Haloechinothrix halophila TaxID=1069073 RepID=UPI00041AFBE6|nr:enoyl-CoA hydratase/isomerase family protein [Haloechinothrix halophila]
MTSADSARTVAIDIDDGVAVVALDRPHRLNAVVPALVDDLIARLDEIAARDDVRAVVLAGNGRAFCAGHDLKEPAPTGDSRGRLERIQHVTRRLRALPQPVIAAVHGYAIGAGAEFALGCDLILAADDTVFAFPEAGLGLSVTGGASRLLPLLVGPVRAKELLLLGERIGAKRALEMGLINRVVAGEPRDAAVEMARELAGKPSYAVTLVKRALDSGIDASLESVLELEVTHALFTENTAAVAASAGRFRERGTEGT